METGKSTIAANGYEGINAVFVQILLCFGTTFFGAEGFTACGFQDCAAALNNITNRTGTQFHNLTINHAFIAPDDAENFFLIVDAAPHDGADGGIHARCVTSRGKDTYFGYFVRCQV
jgi:hypothetical protein